MRNISAKTDNVGDTLPASDFNANLRSELQNVVTSSDQTLDAEGGPDTDVEMLGKAITIYANASQYYQDSGAANSYVLARVGNLKPLVDYIDGVTVMFKAGNSNTGASTINVDSLGAKALRDNTDTALVGGEITANGYVIARYNASNDRFEILFSNSTKDLPYPASGDELKNIQVNSDGDGYELCGPLTSFKNKIINGNFDLWDYATSQTSSGYGSDNRWSNVHSGSTKTHSRQAFTIGQTDVPGNPEYFSRTVVTTASTVSSFVAKSQMVEYVKTLSGRSAVLSFWAKADAAKDIAIEFYQYFGSSGSPSATVDSIGVTTISLTTSWAKYSVNVDIPSVFGKTLGTDLNDYLRVFFWLDAGSNYNARTNSLGNQSGTFDIAQVQLEEGPVATAFENRPPGIEASLCHRYFYQPLKSSGTVQVGVGYCPNSTTHYGKIDGLRPYVLMRTSTPIVNYSGSFDVLRLLTSYAVTSLSFTVNGFGTNVFYQAGVASGLLADAGAILRTNNVDLSIIEYDAEL